MFRFNFFLLFALLPSKTQTFLFSLPPFPCGFPFSFSSQEQDACNHPSREITFVTLGYKPLLLYLWSVFSAHFTRTLALSHRVDDSLLEIVSSLYFLYTTLPCVHSLMHSWLSPLKVSPCLCNFRAAWGSVPRCLSVLPLHRGLTQSLALVFPNRRPLPK